MLFRSYGRAPAVLVLLAVAVGLVLRTHVLHRRREKDEEASEVFNLRKIKDAGAASDVTFEHAGIFLREVATVLNGTCEGLFKYDRARLKAAKADQKRIQRWANIIAANTFKVLRLLQWETGTDHRRYGKTLGALQEISESVRDVVMRSNIHVSNQHAGLLESQIAEIDRLRDEVIRILEFTSQPLEIGRAHV